QELLSSPLSPTLRRRFDSLVRENGRDRRPTDLDLQPTKRVPDLGVAPSSVLGGELDHELADVDRLARPAGLLRTSELSYFLRASCRNHIRSVSGRTIWQHAVRSAGVSALPLIASRRRCSGVKAIRLRPVADARASLSTRTSSWRYSTLRAIRSLSAWA